MERVLIDAREDQKVIDVFKSILSKHDVEIEVTNCDFGDVNVGSLLCIERKTPQDFVSSITDGRLFNQLIGMKQFQHPVVVVEGRFNELLFRHIRRGLNVNSVAGSVASVIVDFNIPLLFADNNSKLLYWHILNRVLRDKKQTVHVFKPKITNYNDARLSAISSVPGVGGNKSAKILKTYRTVFNAISNIDNWAEDVDGVGKKIVEDAKEVFYGEYNDEV